MIPMNILDYPESYIGRSILDQNTFLESSHYAFNVNSSIQPLVWSNQAITFIDVNARVSQGICNHIHYKITLSSGVPTEYELSGSPEWKEDVLIITMPEYSGSYAHFLAHDDLHRSTGETTSVKTYGPYYFDYNAPSGYAVVNSGSNFTESEVVNLVIVASDNLSGIYQMYISGDVTGANTGSWVTFDNDLTINLTSEHRKKTINVRLKDLAGNICDIFSDQIILGLTRYFFKKSNQLNNQMGQKDITLSIKIDNKMSAINNTLKKGDEHGNLSST